MDKTWNLKIKNHVFVFPDHFTLESLKLDQCKFLIVGFNYNDEEKYKLIKHWFCDISNPKFPVNGYNLKSSGILYSDSDTRLFEVNGIFPSRYPVEINTQNKIGVEFSIDRIIKTIWMNL